MSFFPNTYYLLYWHEGFSPCQKVDPLHMHWVQHILGLDLEILAWVFGHEALIKQNCKLGIHAWRLTSNLKIHPIEQENHLSPNVLFFAVNHVSFPGCKRDYRRVLSHPHLRPGWFFITNLSNQHLRLLATRWSCYQRVILSCPNTSRECVKWYSICSRALHLIDGRSTSMIPLLNFWLMLSWWVCTST